MSAAGSQCGMALTMVIVLAGCSSVSGNPTGPTPVAATAESRSEMEALYRARVDSARTKFTPADVRFVTDMIHHHAQAIRISAFAPTHGASSSVQTLAARITNAQKDEIALMQKWLRDRGQPVPELHTMDGAVMVHGDMPMGMPGMLSEQQVAELDRARSTDFDRLFLKDMIEHHRGAVAMVQQLFNTEGAGQDEQVFKLASDVQVDQRTEIARMERMLAAMAGDRPTR